MSRLDVRERDLPRLLDVVASLREVGPHAPTQVGDEPVLVAAAGPPGPGVPWHCLELLRCLLGADELDLHGMDTAAQRHFFVQDVDAEGPAEYCVEAAHRPRIDFRTSSLAAELGAGADQEDAFWASYLASPCSLPDRTGDWSAVIGSEHQSRREAVEWSRQLGYPLVHDLFSAAPVGPSRQVRLLAWRHGWGDFGERERGYLELVKPHVVDAWRRSFATASPLTGAQRHVLALVRDGLTNRQVARELGISEATVRTHLQNVYAALGVTNRVAAVSAAFGADGPGAFTG